MWRSKKGGSWQPADAARTMGSPSAAAPAAADDDDDVTLPQRQRLQQVGRE